MGIEYPRYFGYERFANGLQFIFNNFNIKILKLLLTEFEIIRKI